MGIALDGAEIEREQLPISDHHCTVNGDVPDVARFAGVGHDRIRIGGGYRMQFIDRQRDHITAFTNFK